MSRRDGPQCVFTRFDEEDCDAVHIIPKSKGDEYIQAVVRDRLSLYGQTTAAEITSINAVENGILLGTHLHSQFSHGSIAFLKTPNFALDCADIPRVETDDMPSNRITLQHLVPDNSLFPITDCDAVMAGTGVLPPFNITLDFMYGTAAYRRWGKGGKIDQLMKEYFADHYESIPVPDPDPCTDDEDDDNNNGDGSSKKFRRETTVRRKHNDMSDDMLKAIDNICYLSMMLKGTTPHAIAVERQKQEEEAELHAHESSRMKVQEWITNG